MNKKNIIMLTIAAALFANCAVGMGQQERTIEFTKLSYDFKNEETFLAELKKLSNTYKTIKINFIFDESNEEKWGELVFKILTLGFKFSGSEDPTFLKATSVHTENKSIIVVRDEKP